MVIKKQQKRSLQESQATPTQSNGPANKKLQAPAKKIKTAQAPVQKPPQANGVQGKKAVKAEKPKIAVEQPKKEKKEVASAATDAKAAAKRQKNAEKLKKKNENRKEARKEQGQYKPEKVMMSVEDMELKIKEIMSRPELTKTAKRKLGVLRKRLEIAQGTYVPKPKPAESDGPKTTKSQRRALRKKNEAAKRQAKEEASDSSVPAKTEVVEKGSKKKVALVKVEAPKVEKVAKKPQQVKAKETKKPIVKREDPEDSEDEDDDDDEEEEDDSADEAEDSNASFMNTTEELEDDDDDDDDEDDEEDDDDDEEDEEVAVPTKKIKQEQAKKQPPAKKEVKKETAQNGDDAGKKKRYVLFVGNLPYDVTPDDIKKHFLTKVSAVASVRVPPKPGTTNTSRGFGYVELENATDFEKGLSLQNTILKGRQLKVEYTHSGSKPSGKRPDVVAKNKKLHAMRKQGMLAGSQKDGQKRNDRRQKQRQNSA